jgi:hypothetical protein
MSQSCHSTLFLVFIFYYKPRHRCPSKRNDNIRSTYLSALSICTEQSFTLVMVSYDLTSPTLGIKKISLHKSNNHHNVNLHTSHIVPTFLKEGYALYPRSWNIMIIIRRTCSHLRRCMNTKFFFFFFFRFSFSFSPSYPIHDP